MSLPCVFSTKIQSDAAALIERLLNVEVCFSVKYEEDFTKITISVPENQVLIFDFVLKSLKLK